MTAKANICSLNDSLLTKKDNLYGYAYSGASATETWFKLATITAVNSNNVKVHLIVTRLLYYTGYSATISINLRMDNSVISTSNLAIAIESSTDDAFLLSDYLYGVVESGALNIYCRTYAAYTGWRIDQDKDSNLLTGEGTNSRITYYVYTSGTASGAETSEPSGTKVLPVNAQPKSVYVTNTSWVPTSVPLAAGQSCDIITSGAVTSVITGGKYNYVSKGTLYCIDSGGYDLIATVGAGKTAVLYTVRYYQSSGWAATDIGSISFS